MVTQIVKSIVNKEKQQQQQTSSKLQITILVCDVG